MSKTPLSDFDAEQKRYLEGMAAGISAYEGKSIGGGALTAYLVFTAVTTVRPLPVAGRGVGIVLMALAFTFAAGTYRQAFAALGRPGNQLDGVPAGMFLFLGTVVLLAAIGDLRVLRAGGIQGTRRLARHLWRMCFGLFIASGSFATDGMVVAPCSMRTLAAIAHGREAEVILLLSDVPAPEVSDAPDRHARRGRRR